MPRTVRSSILAVCALFALVSIDVWRTPPGPSEAAPRAQGTGSGPPIRTPTPTRTRVPPTRTPTPTRATPTPSPTPTASPTRVPPSPTLPSFAWLTPTPIIDVFDTPPVLTGPLPSPTLPAFAAPEDVPDLIAVDMEVTQGMQSLANHMPLVAERVTFVRIYVETDGADYLNVKGLVQGSHDGQVLGVIPADNQPITAHGDGGDRIIPDDSLYFGLPWSWLDEGSLHLEAFVYAGDPDAPFEHEPWSFNNFIETTVDLYEAPSIKLSFVPIHLHENYDGNQPEKLFTQQEPGFWPVVIGMLRYLPLPGFQLYAPPVDQIYCGTGPEAGVFEGPVPIGQHGNCEFNLQIPGGADYVTVMMALVDTFTDDATDDLHYYGMVHPDFEPQMTFFNNQGAALSFSGLALNGQAYGLMESTPDGNVPWYVPGAHTLAHELGHRLGLGHVECKGNEEAGGGVDPDYPWPAPNCSIANVNEDGFFGFDVLYEIMPGADEPTVISNDPSLAAPNQGFPLMGYQWPKYADAYHWCMVLQTLGIECDPATTPLLASLGPKGLARAVRPHLLAVGGRISDYTEVDNVELQPGPFLVVTGVIQKDPPIASIGMAITLPEPPADLHEHPSASSLETGFELVLLDAAGQTLAVKSIEETTINHEQLNTVSFLIGLPLAPGTAKLEIRREGQSLAGRDFTPNLPTVQVLTPNGGEVFTAPFEIRWQGSDADGDALTYTLQYSPDGGASWQVLAFGLTGDSYQVLSLYNLTGSDQGKVRVLASDGANTGFDETDGVFSVPNTPPLPAIQAPGYLAVFPLGAQVPMAGSATDREDGVLAPESLTWESNVDGFLGTGERLERSDLSAGYHVLTLTAEDTQGLTAQAHVGITIDPSLRHYVPDEGELALASQILAAGPDWSGSGGAFPTEVLIVVVVLAGVALIGLVFLLPLIRSWMRR